MDAYPEERPIILIEETEYGLNNIKNGKANEPEDIPIELLKLISDKSIFVLLDLFNIIDTTGTIPKEWLTSTFIAIPKKANPKDFNEHCTKALMCHILTLFFRIIHNRIHKKLEREINGRNQNEK